jgi:putative phosphoribosyl transferase
MRFRDRAEAGRHLAERVLQAGLGDDVVVLGLPRGGVPVAYEVADVLGAPLDVVVVRKLGVPFQPELAMGAIGEGGIRVENREVLRAAALSELDLEVVEQRERAELERRAREYRGGRDRLDLRGRCAVIVDDGIATGSSARAAARVARALGASRVVLAAPVASRLAQAELSDVADDVLCVESPEPFYAVGEWYRDFSQTSDAEVVDLLGRSGRGPPRNSATPGPASAPRLEEAGIASGAIRLPAHVCVPPGATGVVAFAHGSGSGRHSPRNREVAKVLNDAGLATVLADLLTADEERDRAAVFDIRLLAERLHHVGRYVRTRPDLGTAPLGYFGASTGAAAALWAAAQPDSGVHALVLRGGRPDLAGPLLPAVTAPTLLIVGGRDETVLTLNRRAQAELRCPNRLVVVPGATHLFEEPGALETVAARARDWFLDHLGSRSDRYQNQTGAHRTA